MSFKQNQQRTQLWDFKLFGDTLHFEEDINDGNFCV